MSKLRNLPIQPFVHFNMTATPYPRHRYQLLLLAAFLFLNIAAFAGSDSMNCSVDPPSGHAELAPGDQNTASHLQLSRPLAAGSEIDLDLCSGDVELQVSKSGNLDVTVDLGRPSSKHLAADYLEMLNVTPHKTTVHLHLTRSTDAKVIIGIPVTATELNTNLARGSLTLAANQVRGERQINVGYGEVKVEANDNAYEEMEINIGLGSLHDHRGGGENHHFIVARSYAGSGKGKIEINVGMGHVDLEPGGDQPI